MSNIQFNVSLDADNKGHMLAASTFFEALAGEVPSSGTIPGKTKSKTPKVEAPKVEAPKVEAPKVEAPKVEAPKVEAPKVEGLTVEFMRKLAMQKAMKSQENKDKHFNWLRSNGYNKVTDVPRDKYPEYKAFLDTL